MAEIKISCPRCRQRIQCDEGYRGTQINCPKCNQPLLIPAAEQPAPTVPAGQQPAKSTNPLRHVVLSLLVLLIVSALGYAVYDFHKYGGTFADFVAKNEHHGLTMEEVNQSASNFDKTLERQKRQHPEAFAKPANKSLTIKGFYIGMPAAEVEAVGRKTFGGIGFEGGARFGDEYNWGASLYDHMAEVRLIMDSKTGGNLRVVWMNADAVNLLFNASDLNVQEFVQKFASAYNLSEFTLRSDDNGRKEYRCESSDGIEITISATPKYKKELYIHRQAIADVNRSFN